MQPITDQWTRDTTANIERKLASFQKVNWDMLAGTELAPKDQLGTDVTNMVRATLEDIATAHKLLPAHPSPHILQFIATAVHTAEAITNDLTEYVRIAKQNPNAVDKQGTFDSSRSRCTSINTQVMALKVIELQGRAFQLDEVRALHSQRLEEARKQYKDFISNLDTANNKALQDSLERTEAVLTRLVGYEQELKLKQDQCANLQKESEDLLKTSKDILTRTTADYQSSAFSSAAEHHEKDAKYWAWAAAGLAGLIMIIAASSMIFGSGPPLPHEAWSTAANVSHFGARTLTVSLLSFLIVVCVRNYRSATHNAITNRHRAKALGTFNALQGGAKTDHAKDVILIQATTAIFSPQPTGYVDGSSGPGTHASELLRAIKPSGSDEAKLGGGQ